MMLVRLSGLVLIAATLTWLAGLAGLPAGQPGVDHMTTAAIPDASLDRDPTRRILDRALDALAKGEIQDVRELQADLPPGSLDARTLLWTMAQSGNRDIAASEIAAAMLQLAAWPDMDRMRANYEKALAREQTTPKQVVDDYAEHPPETLTGAISLARAQLQLDDREAARQALLPWWNDRAIDASTEMLILAQFSDVLTKDDYRQRFLAMMYRDRIRSAERIADRAGLGDYVAPWSAAIRNRSDALDKLDKADDAFKKTPHYLYARIHYLRMRERDKEAAKLLLESPVSADDLVDPDAWWTERRIISRDAFERGDSETAYRIAAMHRGGSTETQVEAAFHAGWYALRGLKNPEKAIVQFEKIETLASGEISRARGAYWLGRAYEAAKSPDAANHYRRAARYATTYYGLLARKQLGLGMADLKVPRVTTQDRVKFQENEVIAAMRRADAIGHDDLAIKLANGIGRTLDNAAEIAQLAAFWEQRNQRTLALRMAKSATWRGIDTGALTHPVGAIPKSAPIPSEERPLAYAVARQESEFNVAARSSANARGLMQLLPATAKEVAQRSGLEYDPSALLTDGGYSAALGTAYLRTQLDRFDGSYILTFIAYNAGPGRAIEWIDRFGDPRGKPLDEVVDWVEQIPFTETRHYVQRVMENLQVYKARLGLPADIAHDLRFGRDS